MTQYSGKSHLRKLTIALLAAALIVSLAVGAYAYAADGDDATPVEITGLVADSNYTLQGDYWRDSNGEYAFYQGMTIDEAIARIAYVQVKMSDGALQDLPIAGNDSITISTREATTGNSSADNVAVPFDVELVVDESSMLTATCEINFIADKPFALEWASAAPDTSSLGLTAATSLIDLATLGLSDGMIRLRMTSGQSGASLMIRDLIAQDSLAPTGSQIDDLVKQGDGAKYDKIISIAYAPLNGEQHVVDSQVLPLQMEVKNIEFLNPNAIVNTILGSVSEQTTKTPFNFAGLQIRLDYGYGETADINLTDVPDYISKVVFLDGTGRNAKQLGEGKDFLLTTQVKAAQITVTIPTTNSSISCELSVSFKVNQKVLEQPIVDNLNPTYKEGGVTVNITNILQDNDNPISMTIDGGVSIVDNTITFDKGGKYTLTITLDEGEEGDYVWGIAGDGQRDENNHYVLTYTIEVNKAPVDVTTDFPESVVYGDSEPSSIIVSATYQGSSSAAFTTSVKGNSSISSDNPVYELFYYGSGYTGHTTVETATTTYPTEPGDYYVIVKTSPTDKFAQGESSAQKFTVTKRPISLTATFNSPLYIRGKIYDTVELKKQLNIAGIADQDKPNQDKVVDVAFASTVTQPVTHAGSYAVKLTITNAYKNKYMWAGKGENELTGDATFTIQKRPQVVSASVATSSFDYGTVGADPNPSYIWTTELAYQYASIGAPHYFKQGSTTEISNPDFSKLDAGEYVVKYDVSRGTGDNANDYDLPTLEATFTINHIYLNKVNIANWSDDSATPYEIGVYGVAHNVTINNWLPENVSPTGALILTSTVAGTRLDGITAITAGITNGQNGAVTLTQAGTYAITISLNSNYKWTDGTNADVVLYGKIDKQTVSNAALSSSSSTYNGAGCSVSVNVVVGTSTAAWATDALNGNANIVNITSVTGSKNAAAVLAANVTDYDNNDGHFVVKYAGEYTVALALNDTKNYKWAQGEATSLIYTVEQAMYRGAWDNQSPYQFVSGADKQAEPTFTMSPVAGNATATADVSNITPQFTLYNSDFVALNPQKVTEAGTFYKVVTSLVSSDNSHLNYYVPEENADTADRKVSTVFVISSAGLDKIVLTVGSTGATISGNDISVVYKHSAYKLSDFITDWNKYYYNSGNATIQYLDITVTGVSGQNPELTSVKIESGAVAAYVIKVKPATNYEWKENQGLSADEEITFTITINQLAVDLKWNNTSKDYSDNATTTVSVDNRGSDDVSVNYVYVNSSSAEIAIADVKNAVAGNYTLLAKALTGAAASNYTLTGGSNVNDTPYTIYKKGIAKPLTNAAKESPVGMYNDGKTASLYSNQGALLSGLFSVNVTGYYPSEWFEDSEDNKTFDVNESVFNKQTGVFSYVNAGYYTFVFSINSAANYCWADEYDTEKEAFATNEYTHSWIDLVVVSRAPVSAPVLGQNRAMEWTNVADLSSVFTGSTGSVSYGVQYGVFGGSYGEPQDAQAGGTGSVASSARGEYYALLTINGDDRYNYVWTVSASDNEGSTYVTRISKTTFTTDNGSQVYLHYAITASQLPVFYQLKLNEYVFGANGVAIGSNSITALGIDDLLEMTGADDDVANAKTGTITYAFYKSGTDERYTKLVNGLPWEAGVYDVRITIAFAETSEYSTMTIRTNDQRENLTFEVSPRAIEVAWTFDNKSDLSAIFNNAEQHVNAVITNIPVSGVSEIDDVTEATLTWIYKLNGSAVMPVNAATYAVEIDTIEGISASNFTKTGSSDGDLTCSFVINPYAVTVTATGVSGHIYGNDVIDSEKAFDVTSDNKFFGSDVNGIKVQIWNDTLTAQYVKTNNVGTYKVVPTWNGTLPAEKDEVYTIEAGNYIITVKLADFKVVARQITVTFNAANATSTYGAGVNLYQTDKPIYNVSWTNAEGQNASDWLVGSAYVTSVFTLTSEATVAYKNVDEYAVTLTKVADNNNYAITVDGNTVADSVELGKYVITPATITDISAIGYTGVYDNSNHAMFTLAAATVNNQTVSWYYQDVSASDKTLWTAYDLSNPNTVKSVADSGKYYIKAVAANHNDVIYNTDGVNNVVEVKISRATLYVQINLSIWYGEQDPAALIDGAYKATVADLKSNAMYVVTGFATGEDIATITGVSGDFSYTTTYAQGNSATDYNITFVNDTLIADNYEFVNNNTNKGVLTVNKLSLTVTVDDISTVYYSTNFSYALFNGSVHIDLPASTYTGATLTQAELHTDVWNKIYNDSDAFEGAQLLNVTTTAYTSAQSNGVTKDVDEYTITCTLRSDATANYSIASAVTAKHTITPAELEVLEDDINGYNNPYDEMQHNALNKADGAALTTFANAKGGMTVSVLFIVANATDIALTAEQIAALDWANDGVAAMPVLIDVCSKVVYFRIGAQNHNYAYGQRTVSITKVDNVFTNESEIVFGDWTYGLYEAASNVDGYNAATYSITDATARFSRKDGVNGANKLYIELTCNSSAVMLDKTYEKASEMFAYMWDNGLFVAGEYSLTITMDGTSNYEALAITKKFTVAKKQLTVTAVAQTVTYGDDAPEYDYAITGFVNNGLGLETQQQILGDILSANGNLFTSDYQAGRLNGFAGTHPIYRYTDVDKTTVAGGLNNIAETDNYTLLFVDGIVTVNKREVTISIADAANRYNLSVIVDGAYTTQAAATYGFVLNEGSSFFDTDVAFEIHTEAMTAASEGKRTNNAGTYPIYVRWLSYEDNNGEQVRYDKNYIVKFAGCSYNGEMPSDAITQNGVKCAGTYTIEKAELIVNILGPYNDANGTTNATNDSVFSNTYKYYKAVVEGSNDKVDFVVAYYDKVVNNGIESYVKRDDAPFNAGEYRVTASTNDPNYVAQTAYIGVSIAPATVVVGWELIEGSETIAAQIEYGTSITALDATNNYPENDRFDGLTYTFASKYFDHDVLIDLLSSAITRYHYNTSYTTATAPSQVRITPIIEGSPNFVFSTEYGILQVISRKITVQVNGWDNGNPDYATSPYSGKSPFDGNNGSWDKIKSWFTTVESDAFVNGHSLQSLGITLEIDGTTAYDASATAYKVNVIKGTNTVSGYYNVKFVVGYDKNAYPATKPTYLITKKAITLKVLDKTVTYGNTINDNLINGFEVGSLNGVTFIQYFEFVGMLNTDRGTYGFDASGSADNVYKFAFDYTPYVTDVGNVILSVDESASTIEFTNYAVETFVAGKVTVTPRVITASTKDVIYTEAVDGDGNKVYNNGVYGAAHIAAIMYSGHDNGTGYADIYVPTATLTYTTTSTGQTAAQAPTKVGAYKVNVKLTNPNYIYDTANSNVSDNGKTLTLNFNVNKQTLNPSWLNSSIQNTEDTDPADLQNYITRFVQSIMEIQQFQKTAMDNVVTDILAGTTPDSYQVGTVGSENVGLYITVYGTGEYRVTLTLTEAAKANYQWTDNASSVTLIFNVATDKVTISNLTISGWIYGESANQVTFTVSNENTDGVQISYAKIPQGYDSKPSDSNINALKLWYQGLTYSASIPTDAGDYAVKAYYPAYAGVNGDEKYATFTISKATMSTPTLMVTEGNDTFNGEQLTATLTFDTLKVRINNYNGTTYSLTSTGATIYATNAGGYTVTFSLIDSDNYQWGGNASSQTWTVAKATNNEVTFTNSEAEKNIVYGNRIIPRAVATYNGTIDFRYMAKTSDVEPERNDANWLMSISKFVVGEYWVMAVNSGNSNYNGDYAITSFKVTPAILTVTPSGSMTYGETFSNSNSTLQFVISGGRVQGDNPDDIINVMGEFTYELVDATDKLNAITYGLVLKSDENGVIGLSADNYKIVSGVGEFVVNKRDITVTLGTATSQYGRAINLDNVSVTYGDGELIKGDSLNLVLDTAAQADSIIGGYTITASYNNDNYNITIVTGVYTITERRITIEIVAGGGVYGETIAPVTFGKVLDDADVEITDFVTGKLTLTVIYNGTANDGTVCNGAMPTHAGTYLATVKGSDNANFIIVGEPFTQFVVDKKVLDGSKITIDHQTYTELALEPVVNNAAFVAEYGDDLYIVLEHDSFINAGVYAVTLRLKDAYNYKWQSVEVAEYDLAFTIDKADNELTSNIQIAGWIYGEYDVQANAPSANVKFGQGDVVFVYSDSLNGVYHTGAPASSDVGEYYVRVTVAATDNYNAYTSDPVKFAIGKKALAQPTLTIVTEGEGKNDVYTGSELLSTLVGFDMSLMNLDYEGINVSGGQVIVRATNAGTYLVHLSINTPNNYCWQGTDGNEITLSWTIAPKAIAKPTQNTNLFMVNGKVLTYIPNGFDEEIMTIEGNQTAYGGEFPVTIGLKDKANYVWIEGGTDDFTLTWKVVGVNTVFYIVVGVLSGACAIALVTAGVQLLLDRRKKRLIDHAIDVRSQAEANKTKTETNNEGGND